MNRFVFPAWPAWPLLVLPSVGLVLGLTLLAAHTALRIGEFFTTGHLLALLEAVATCGFAFFMVRLLAGLLLVSPAQTAVMAAVRDQDVICWTFFCVRRRIVLSEVQLLVDQMTGPEGDRGRLLALCENNGRFTALPVGHPDQLRAIILSRRPGLPVVNEGYEDAPGLRIALPKSRP